MYQNEIIISQLGWYILPATILLVGGTCFFWTKFSKICVGAYYGVSLERAAKAKLPIVVKKLIWYSLFNWGVLSMGGTWGIGFMLKQVFLDFSKVEISAQGIRLEYYGIKKSVDLNWNDVAYTQIKDKGRRDALLLITDLRGTDYCSCYGDIVTLQQIQDTIRRHQK